MATGIGGSSESSRTEACEGHRGCLPLSAVDGDGGTGVIIADIVLSRLPDLLRQ